jgi:hypothetical protein
MTIDRGKSFALSAAEARFEARVALDRLRLFSAGRAS